MADLYAAFAPRLRSLRVPKLAARQFRIADSRPKKKNFFSLFDYLKSPPAFRHFSVIMSARRAATLLFLRRRVFRGFDAVCSRPVPARPWARGAVVLGHTVATATGLSLIGFGTYACLDYFDPLGPTAPLTFDDKYEKLLEQNSADRDQVFDGGPRRAVMTARRGVSFGACGGCRR